MYAKIFIAKHFVIENIQNQNFLKIGQCLYKALYMNLMDITTVKTEKNETMLNTQYNHG